ncbi:MAG: hypothetical protein ACREJ3_05300 [Polyangiaceae bacterium]
MAPLDLTSFGPSDKLVDEVPAQAETYAADPRGHKIFFAPPEHVPAPQLASPLAPAFFFLWTILCGATLTAALSAVAAGVAAEATGAAVVGVSLVGGVGALGAAEEAAGAAGAPAHLPAAHLPAEHEAWPAADAEAAGVTSVAFTG